MAETRSTGHFRSALTVLLLIFFFPVGLFLLWTHKSWKRGTKIVVSVFVLGIVAVIMFSHQDPTTSSVGRKTTSTLAVSPKQTPEQARLDSISNALRLEQERAERKEAARKAEEEYEADGLVLLRKTLKGTRGEYSGEITGTVINRRNATLSYVQISFNLYDETGAQVGSALANVNNLEAGGRWNFKALALEDNWRSFKVAELSGF